MKYAIPYARQDIDEEDIASVIKVLRSDWLTQGPTILEFEAICASYCQAKYALAVNSATSALHLACLALGLGPNDLLWTSPNTFVASSNCGLYCGAKVDFVDIDSKTYNISLQALEEKLLLANQQNALPKVLVVVHFAGQSCDMVKIKALADRYDIKVIEDASHAIGGKYLNTPVGACHYSDVTILSFHPVKIITTGEGGMVVTNSLEIKEKVELLRTHGNTRDPEKMTRESEGAWCYEQIALGYNYRQSDIHASLGLSQMKRIDTFISRRNELARQYDEALSALPVITPYQSPDCYHAYHLYPIQLCLEKITKTRKTVFDELRNAEIYVNVHYIPVHTQPYYHELGFKKGDFPASEFYYERAISLPMYYRLTDHEQIYVVDTLKHILS